MGPKNVNPKLIETMNKKVLKEAIDVKTEYLTLIFINGNNSASSDVELVAVAFLNIDLINTRNGLINATVVPMLNIISYIAINPAMNSGISPSQMP